MALLDGLRLIYIPRPILEVYLVRRVRKGGNLNFCIMGYLAETKGKPSSNNCKIITPFRLPQWPHWQHCCGSQGNKEPGLLRATWFLPGISAILGIACRNGRMTRCCRSGASRCCKLLHLQPQLQYTNESPAIKHLHVIRDTGKSTKYTWVRPW